MTTFVTAFLTNVNSNRTIDQYIEYGNHLLTINEINKVVFIEKSIYDKYFQNNSFQNIRFVFIALNDLYLYKDKDRITNFFVNSTNICKDTFEYMCVQCNKTEWVKEAVELNPFNDENYIWIDFGIKHMVNDVNFTTYICKMANVEYKNKIRIAGCWDINSHSHSEIYKNVMWYFAGSVFGGNKESLLKFATLTKEQCLKTTREENTIMWEVNIWWLVYCLNKNLFDIYKANHDPSILHNYHQKNISTDCTNDANVKA
jgi:hypothetical protein